MPVTASDGQGCTAGGGCVWGVEGMHLGPAFRGGHMRWHTGCSYDNHVRRPPERGTAAALTP